ncbi:MAG TPA: diguanylate cyclase [bacterium]|nr:diguanylate cyclase [bacterium]
MAVGTIEEFALRYLLDNTRLVTMVFDGKLNVVEAGQGCTAVLGYPTEEMIGRSIYEIVVVENDSDIPDLVEGEGFENEMIRVRTAFDSDLSLFSSFHRVGDGSRAFLVGQAIQPGSLKNNEITMELHKKAFSLAKTGEELRRRNAYLELANQRIRESQVTDANTGLFKRNYLDRLLRAEWERAKRHNDDISFMLISVDGLRALRELQGPEAASRILRGVARVLEGRKRIFDGLGHFDTDSFYMILPHTGMEGASELADRLLTMLRDREVRIGDYPFRIYLSVGVSWYNLHQSPLKTFDELIHKAADSLMRAQMAGGNQVQVAEAGTSTLRIVP